MEHHFPLLFSIARKKRKTRINFLKKGCPEGGRGLKVLETRAGRRPKGLWKLPFHLHAVFGAIRRHVEAIDKDVLEKAAAHIAEQFPGCGEAVEAAKQAVLARGIDSERPKDTRGRKAEVEPFSAFLLVFMYVFGGQLEFMAPILPGIECSMGHFSRLLSIYAPVVKERWASEYYKKRDVSWLSQHAGPKQRSDEKLRKADVVLVLDRGVLKCEKSHGLREEDCEDDVRVLVLSALSGEIAELSTASGARSIERELAECMNVFERWDKDAEVLQKHIKIHVIIHRAFDDFQQAIEKKKWSRLDVSVALKRRGKVEEGERNQ
jgi:hypothetical protein